MILCPLQNTALFDKNWMQIRPYITQYFGNDPYTYGQFGLKGHNGIDFRAAIGTPIFAPFDGKVKTKNSGNEGYGLHIRMRGLDRECVLGHLEAIKVLNGQYVKTAQLLGFTGNSGFSTGPHLHMGVRQIERTGQKDIFTEKVIDYNNGYFGYYDHLQYMICWKGGFIDKTFK